MKIINTDNNCDIDYYTENEVVKIVCDMYKSIENATGEEINKFVKLNISDEVDNLIKSKLSDSESLSSAYEQAKYTKPSLKETFEFELNNIYYKYNKAKNATS